MNFNKCTYLIGVFLSASVVSHYVWCMELATISKAQANEMLEKAIIAHNIEGVLQALSAKAEINNTNGPIGRTPLHTAVNHSAPDGGLDIVIMLIEKGAQLNAFDSDESWRTGSVGRTPLHYAAEDGYTAVARLLLDRGANVNMPDGYYGRTPLYDAARHGRTPTAELLLDRGADINMRNRYGQTPLHEGASHGSWFVTKLLLERGAEVNPVDKNGRTPLDEAASTFCVDAARLLLQKGAYGVRYTPLQIAARLGNVEAVRQAVLPEIGASDGDGWTLLHVAAACQYTEMFKLLLNRGADSAQQNVDGNTPLHLAVDRGCLEIVALLYDAHTLNTIQNNDRQIPLDLAHFRNRAIIVQILQQAECEADQTTTQEVVVGRNEIQPSPAATMQDLLPRRFPSSSVLGAGVRK